MSHNGIVLSSTVSRVFSFLFTVLHLTRLFIPFPFLFPSGTSPSFLYATLSRATRGCAMVHPVVVALTVVHAALLFVLPNSLLLLDSLLVYAGKHNGVSLLRSLFQPTYLCYPKQRHAKLKSIPTMDRSVRHRKLIIFIIVKASTFFLQARRRHVTGHFQCWTKSSPLFQQNREKLVLTSTF